MLEDVPCLELPGEVSTVLRLALPRFVHLQVRVGDPHAWHIHTEVLRALDSVNTHVTSGTVPLPGSAQHQCHRGFAMA